MKGCPGACQGPPAPAGGIRQEPCLRLNGHRTAGSLEGSPGFLTISSGSGAEIFIRTCHNGDHEPSREKGRSGPFHPAMAMGVPGPGAGGRPLVEQSGLVAGDRRRAPRARRLVLSRHRPERADADPAAGRGGRPEPSPPVGLQPSQCRGRCPAGRPDLGLPLPFRGYHLELQPQRCLRPGCFRSHRGHHSGHRNEHPRRRDGRPEGKLAGQLQRHPDGPPGPGGLQSTPPTRAVPPE